MKIERFEAGRLQPVVLDNPAQAVAMRTDGPQPVLPWRAAVVKAVIANDAKGLVRLQREHGVSNSTIGALRAALADVERLRSLLAQDALLLANGDRQRALGIARSHAGVAAIEQAIAERESAVANIQHAVTSAHREVTGHHAKLREFREAHPLLLGSELVDLLGPAPTASTAQQNAPQATHHPLLPAILRGLKRGDDIGDMQLEAGVSDGEIHIYRDQWGQWQKLVAEREPLEKAYQSAQAVDITPLRAEIDRLAAALVAKISTADYLTRLNANLTGQRMARLAELRQLADTYRDWGLIQLTAEEAPPPADYRIGRGGTM